MVRGHLPVVEVIPHFDEEKQGGWPLDILPHAQGVRS
jgi:hypothetical protein